MEINSTQVKGDSPNKHDFTLKLTINLRDGTKKQIVQPVGNMEGTVDLGVMHKSVQNLQEQANSLLTQIVESEKNQGSQPNMTNNTDDVDDDDEEDSEEEDTQPEEKRQKR